MLNLLRYRHTIIDQLKTIYRSFGKSSLDVRNPILLFLFGDGYGHPSYTVMDYFDRRRREVHVANYVGGYKRLQERQAKMIKLDMINYIMLGGLLTVFSKKIVR